MKRRGFLQQAGWILAALGTSEAGFAALGNRATQVLAQPTQRKLALLVGIDRYVDAAYGNNGVPLSGCTTDVELQRELLIHRFGFQASDILTLTNTRATRSQIETAFITHLREQAKPGDVVVFREFRILGTHNRVFAVIALPAHQFAAAQINVVEQDDLERRVGQLKLLRRFI